MNNFLFRNGTWDKAIFDCVNTHNEYKLPTTFKPADIVVDIGTHIGSFAYACLTRGASKVYAYEAMKDNFDLATENLKQFGDKVKVEHAAVWRSDQQVKEIYFTPSYDAKNTGGGNVWSSSVDVDAKNFIPALAFDSIIEAIGQPIKLLKLDCEGSEFPILLTSKKLSAVESICGEYHEFGGHYDTNVITTGFKVDGYDKYTIKELSVFLKEQGYKVSFTRSTNADGTPCNLGLFFATR